MKIRVTKEKDEVVVSIMRHKGTDEYSFINLTKEHICPCRFNSVKEALDELNKRVEDGTIIEWEYFK